MCRISIDCKHTFRLHVNFKTIHLYQNNTLIYPSEHLYTGYISLQDIEFF